MRDPRSDATLGTAAEPDILTDLAHQLVWQLHQVSPEEHVSVVRRWIQVEMDTRAQAAQTTRTEDVPLPPGLGAVRARTIAASLVDALQPAVEAVRRDCFGSPDPPFAPRGSDGRASFESLAQAAAGIEAMAATQPSPAPGALTTLPALLARAEAAAREAATLVGCEFEVRLVTRSLDYVKPVATKPVAKAAAHIVGRIKGVGWLVRARVPIWAPAVEVTEAEIRPPATASPLWRLERACRAWALATPFPIPGLVDLVLRGVPPVFPPVRFTLTHSPSWSEMTLVDRTGEVTETQVLTLWRAARQKLGRYRRQRMTPAQEAFVTVVRRVLTEEGVPATFSNTTFWTRVREEEGGARTWRAAAKMFERAFGVRTPREALAALKSLAPRVGLRPDRGDRLPRGIPR